MADPILQEETLHLEETEKQIRQAGETLEQEAERLRRGVFGVKNRDADDRTEWQKKRELLQSKQDKARHYSAVLDKPYFARMDFDCSDTDMVESFYIGDAAVEVDSDYIVYDWRSDVGSCYYMKSETNFHVKDISYRLQLRRALEVQNGKLRAYNTEYEANRSSAAKEIVDPFLVTVLKDKRRKKALTDIIRTIQENQNKMIRLPRNQSFVVQGCAGSGKTMILLHRLSYLIFNNPGMDLRHVKIIAPNRYFNTHINGLSEKLGLHRIERFSVEQYYVYLIKGYSGKVEASDQTQSEAALNTDFLREIYSAAFLDELKTRYHAWWDETSKLLRQTGIAEQFALYGMEMPSLQRHHSDEMETALAAVRELARKSAGTQQHIRELTARMEEARTKCTLMQKQQERDAAALDTLKGKALQEIDRQRDSVWREMEKIHTGAEINRGKARGLEDRIADIRKRSQTHRANARNAQNQRKEYLNRKSAEAMLASGSEAAQYVLRQTEELRRQLNETEQECSKIAFYNFSGRNRLKKRIAELESEYRAKAGEIIDSYCEHCTQQADEFDDYDRKFSEELNEIRAGTAEKKKEEACREALKSLENLKAALNGQSPKESGALPVIPQELQTEPIRAYLDKLENYKEQQTRGAALADELLRLQAEYEKAVQAQAKKNQDKTQQCEEILERLSWASVVRNVLTKSVQEKQRLFGVTAVQGNYRYKLYLRLALCSLYFAHPNVSDNLLCIDEAQDISAAEYRLLYEILGRQCVFNLYGDVDQLVYEYKGITDWTELHDIVGDHIEILNENYRNTAQITEFCNREFDAKVQAIGIDGPDVAEADLEDSIRQIAAQRQADPMSRAAVIYKPGNPAREQRLRKIAGSFDAAWGELSDRQISFVTPEQVKGLEFEACAAIVDGMSDNERYIAFTRALNRLFVVREAFQTEHGSHTEKAGSLPPKANAEPAFRMDPALIRLRKEYGSPAKPRPAADAGRTAVIAAPQPEREIPSDPNGRKKDFGVWLAEKKEYSHTDINSFFNALAMCDVSARREKMYGGSVFCMETAQEMDRLTGELLKLPRIHSADKANHGRYRRALNLYAEYLRQQETNAPTVKPIKRESVEAARTIAAATEKPCDIEDESTYTGKKPYRYELAGESVNVKSWKEVLVGVVNRLFLYNEPAMEKYCDRPVSRSSQKAVFGKSVQTAIRTETLANGLPIDTVQSAYRVLLICNTLCEDCGLSKQDFKVYTA